jgi:RNA polymerase sigma-70 factor (ECF subfamily)
MVLRATGSLAEAEDCVHDALLRLVRRDDLDPARVRSLLIRAALHIAIDHRRAAARQQSAVVRLRGGADSDVVSPEQVLAQRAEAARVLAAVDSLPRRERQVMLLRLAGLSVAETAARLGISAKSVEGAYTRARARVRYLLGAAFGWLADRLRRSGSPGGEAAATVAAAALLLLGPGSHDDVRGPLPVANAPARAPRAGAHVDARAESARPAASRPGADRDPLGPERHPAASPRAPQSSRPGWKAHNPPPDTTVGAPIDAPDGLASTGVYISLHPPDPSTYPQAAYGYPKALEDCVELTVAHPDRSC